MTLKMVLNLNGVSAKSFIAKFNSKNYLKLLIDSLVLLKMLH